MTAPPRSWSDLHAAPRHSPSQLTREQLPDQPGVYAWYQGGTPAYVGKASSLRARVWGNHLGQSVGLTGSAFRRNVAHSLGHGTPAQIKQRQITLTDAQRTQVRAWILGCEVTWLVCASPAAALALETALKREHQPALTRR
jgi:hypothetical protein